MSKPVPTPRIEPVEIMQPGTSSCQGCGHGVIARNAMKTFGENTVFISVPGCIWITIQSHIPLYWTGTSFQGGAALLSGITNALEMIFPQVDKEYPDSKFIHIVRDKDIWLDSAEKHWDRTLERIGEERAMTIHHHLITVGTYLFNKDIVCITFITPIPLRNENQIIVSTLQGFCKIQLPIVLFQQKWKV